MIDYYSLSMGISNVTSCSVSKRLCFVIFYTGITGRPQPQFQYAAETWKSEMLSRGVFNPTQGIFLMEGVKSEGDFRIAWNKIYRTANDGGYQVFAGNLFTHSSAPHNFLGKEYKQTGLEFARSGEPSTKKSDDGTLTSKEVLSLRKLPWEKSFGHLILSGCNSGLSGKGGVASAMAFRQKVAIVGLMRTSRFSKAHNTYKEVSDRDKKIYLWSYDSDSGVDIATKGSSFSGGTGMRVPGKVFIP